MGNMKRWIRRLLIWQLLAAVLTAWAAALPAQLVPVGSAVGIRLESDGLLVVGFDGEHSAARDAGIKKGDIIKAAGGKPVRDSAAFKEMVASGGPLELTLLRDGKPIPLTVEPAREGAQWRLGLLLRDSMAGIGTVTFYDPERDLYGALGHGVNDMQSMVLLPLAAGEILPASVVEVQRGESGSPGILKGAFDAASTLGTVEANTEHGIFGRGAAALGAREAVPVATRGEIHTGKAVILSNIEGRSVEEFEVEITKLFPTEQSGRNLLLTVTDERLLRATGGIVQGMSGSPILQDGRIVGAVTHVLVDNPTLGYGIFIEDMLESAGELFDTAA